jgi:rhodanese-related sulfurtransferase
MLAGDIFDSEEKNMSDQQLASNNPIIEAHLGDFQAADALVNDATSSAVLQQARVRATADGLAYAGDISPLDAFELFSAGLARLIDVRTPEERKFVGYIADSVSVPWATGTALTRNPRFLRELENKAQKTQVLLFICRSGARSIAAAEAATRGQFQHAFNVLEGFEGELDAQRRRGTQGGWRWRGLPWIQD